MSESLIVELNAKTAKLDKALDETNNKLDHVEKNTTKADKALHKMSDVASAVGSALTKTATAGLALATALVAVVVKSAKSQQELSLLSRQAKLSTDDFEALAFATKQYGINAEQIADISKDLSDKMGEFSKVGTGAFKDFADIVGLTKDEAMKAATEFENMSSDQVIGEMVRQMEAAGASSNQMTFALESMGNDLSRLIPLFSNNSKELDNLTKIYGDATKQLKLTNAEIEGLQGAATSFDLMTDSLVKGGNLISAQIAPLLDEFFTGVISVVPEATQVVVDFINSFKEADAIKSIGSMNRLIEEQKIKVQELRIAQTELGTSFSSMFDSEKSITTQKEQLNLEIEKEVQRIDELIIARDKLKEQEAKADAERPSSGGISATLAPVENANEEKIETELEYQARLKEIKDQAAQEDLEREAMLADAFADFAGDDAKSIDKTNKLKEQSDQNYFNAASTLGNAFFEDNKAIKAGLVVVDTAAGISKAFAELPYPAALAASASIAATGIAQLAAIQGASKGGGGVSGGGVAGANITAEPETELTISDTDESGRSQSQVITIKLESDDTETARFISGIINDATVSGNI